MRRFQPSRLMLLALFCAGSAAAQSLKVGDTVSFITCPIAQDRGPEVDLCFFVNYRGQRISLNTQTFDSTGIMLRHQILVEGRVIDAPEDCGGIRIEGMTSALKEISAECNEVRPFEPRFAPPPPDPARMAEMLARLRVDPSISVRPTSNTTALFEGPVPRDWRMGYTFDSDRGDGVALQALVAMVQAAVRDDAPSISVHGYRGASRLDSGKVVEEEAGLARQRAEKIAGIIAGLGYPRERIRVAWTEAPPRPNGRDDWRNRKVTASLGQ